MKKQIITLLATSLALVTLSTQFGSINASALTTTLIPLDNFSSVSLCTKLEISGVVDSNFNSVGAGNVDCVAAPDYGFSTTTSVIDLNGSTKGELKSNLLSFETTDTLTLSFDYGGNFFGSTNDKTATVSVGSLSVPLIVKSDTKGKLASFTKTFKAGSGAKNLDFLSTNDGAEGVLITNVTLTKVDPTLIPLDNFSSVSLCTKLEISGVVDSNFNSVGAGNVDCVAAPDYGFSTTTSVIDLNGSTKGELKSKLLDFKPEDTLTLSFEYSGNFAGGDTIDKTATVSVGGFSDELTAKSVDKGLLKSYTKTFPAGVGAKYLDFLSTIDGNAGILITNVKLTKLDAIIDSPAVPVQTFGGALTLNIGATSNSPITSNISSILNTSSITSSRSAAVLGFSTNAQEQGLNPANTIDPTTTKILVSSELKATIDSAKGRTVRTGGLDN
jgi:hypothetical protein